ncbi:hypothetical protein EJ04DRAFT_562711 [Polyplosphaeria fusca]|uniref:Uncharacterized protein n=1 Tax=Polyplosphaeria fusca TaxID=682080 RepID=A0A9P4R0Z8_9PLEO|nr:hypothetical protein EJ04DRAFT_562711 [Polyplosphaeria fusca]
MEPDEHDEHHAQQSESTVPTEPSTTNKRKPSKGTQLNSRPVAKQPKLNNAEGKTKKPPSTPMLGPQVGLNPSHSLVRFAQNASSSHGVVQNQQPHGPPATFNHANAAAPPGQNNAMAHHLQQVNSSHTGQNNATAHLQQANSSHIGQMSAVAYHLYQANSLHNGLQQQNAKLIEDGRTCENMLRSEQADNVQLKQELQREQAGTTQLKQEIDRLTEASEAAAEANSNNLDSAKQELQREQAHSAQLKQEIDRLTQARNVAENNSANMQLIISQVQHKERENERRSALLNEDALRLGKTTKVDNTKTTDSLKELEQELETEQARVKQLTKKIDRVKEVGKGAGIKDADTINTPQEDLQQARANATATLETSGDLVRTLEQRGEAKDKEQVQRLKDLLKRFKEELEKIE